MSAVDALAEAPLPAPITETPVATPTPTSAPQPKVENRPLLMMYQDETGKRHVLIAGNGQGTWLLPKSNEVPREDLDKHQHTLIPKTSFHLIDFGHTKPSITVQHHQVFSWVSLDLAKTILGEQFEHLIPKDVQQEMAGQPHTPTIPPITTAPVPASAPPHADTCTGCDSCTPHSAAPKPAALAHGAQHMGVSEPTASMLAMHGPKTTTHIGAMM
jgi:hypothetical protein